MKNHFYFTRVIFLLLLSKNLLNGQTNSPKSYSSKEGFVAHEWGTFTSLRSSDGKVLIGLQKEEEALPGFVENICFCHREQLSKGYPISTKYDILKNVTIKMETPVIYFYWPEDSEKRVTVDVQFPKGSISQWYPRRSDGETLDPDMVLYLDYLPAPPPKVIDFANPHQGFIRWNATILRRTVSPPYTNNDKTKQWLAQRNTASNLIMIEQTYNTTAVVEKFLFYRGLGNFTEPVDITFNSQGNLVISNNSPEKLSYVLVFERTDNGVIIHWSGNISGQTVKVVQRLSTLTEDPTKEMEKFVSRLVSSGLYEDEARAMLKTWEQSYFNNKGLKVFWIVPKSFTEEVLPLSISPRPASLNRVLVGRSEILTPEFEKEMLDASTFNEFYKNDRFELAYKELQLRGIPQKWSDYNLFTEDEAEPVEPDSIVAGIQIQTNYSNFQGVEIYPNPSTGDLTVKIFDIKDQQIILKLYSEKGSLINSFSGIRKGENKIPFETLSTGTYLLEIEYEDGKTISKKIVKR